ncbi:MAG: HlyD family efflux transporter periplasmic adaptor subunit [Chloroflexota bacterium]
MYELEETKAAKKSLSLKENAGSDAYELPDIEDLDNAYELEDLDFLRRHRRRRRRRLLFGLVLLLVIAGGIYAYTSDSIDTVVPASVTEAIPNTLPFSVPFLQPAQQVASEEAAPATAPVRRGDILITAGGVGTVLPGNEMHLAFSVAGTVKELYAQVGDSVEAGELLAVLDDADVRRTVVQAGIDLRQAEIQLENATESASVADTAAAQASLAAAQSEYNNLVSPPSSEELTAAQNELLSAQQSLNTLLSGLTAEEDTTLRADLKNAEVNLAAAQSDYDQVAWRSDIGRTQQAAALQQATIAYEKALAQYNLSAAGPKEEEIATARARVAQAQEALNQLQQGADSMAVAASQAKVTQAQAQLADLMTGPDGNDLEAVTLAVQQSRLNLEAAIMDLDGTLIQSPVAGVVTAVNAQRGEQASTGTIITVAEYASAQVRFWIEELDIANAQLGNPVTMIFEAFPDNAFHGEIIRVEPSLVTVDGASAVQAWASIDLAEHPVNLLFGMNAEIEIIAGEATNALLVPVQALRELAPGVNAVFVVASNGELELRPVEVGLRDFVNAEILSGLSDGETVSTGDVDTQ